MKRKQYLYEKVQELADSIGSINNYYQCILMNEVSKISFREELHQNNKTGFQFQKTIILNLKKMCIIRHLVLYIIVLSVGKASSIMREHKNSILPRKLY